MTSETSGWYARLDHECPERTEQIQIWLDSWLEATKKRQPIAAALPNNWPTLPAGLLSNPGNVLDHLLARFDAQRDGRSPRGVYAPPARFVDAVLHDELDHGNSKKKEPPATLSLAALPPSFRGFAKQFNEDISEEGVIDGSAESSKNRTESGIPIPFADPCVGAGLFAERMLRIHAERLANHAPTERREDTLRLLEGLQLVDTSEVAVNSARKRIVIVLARLGLVDLEDEGDDGIIGLSEAEMIVESNVRCIDPLMGEWPWNERPMLLISRPPWLRIKDRFRGHPDGSTLRKELSSQLREFKGTDGKARFSTIKGNVNLYRLYIERSLQISQSGGRVRLVVPSSVLREKSSLPLRKLLVESNCWDSVWSFPEDSRLLFGGSQGVSVIGITVGEETDVLTSFGPLLVDDLAPGRGLASDSPFFELERGPWSSWTDTSWAVPKMPRDDVGRSMTIMAIGKLADKPRLVEEGTGLNPSGRAIKVRVGEVESSVWKKEICDWTGKDGEVPFIRAAHINFKDGKGVLGHPAFELNSEGGKSAWKGPSEMLVQSRIVCQSVVNPQSERRLVWAVVPEGCVLGNSVSFLDLPNEVKDSLSEKFGSLEGGLDFLAGRLNSEELDLWSRAWAANNNVNNYEIEMLPFEVEEDVAPFSLLRNEGRLD
ncbi:MAG: Eco57I restriction-modification methylase domain-containing protein [Candidatus Thalassarchaeaceae archaeon]